MCEVNAICPHCHRPDLDQFETKCTTLNKTHFRVYDCPPPCGAHITVRITESQVTQ